MNFQFQEIQKRKEKEQTFFPEIINLKQIRYNFIVLLPYARAHTQERKVDIFHLSDLKKLKKLNIIYIIKQKNYCIKQRNFKITFSLFRWGFFFLETGLIQRSSY